MKRLLILAAAIALSNPALGDDKYKDLKEGRPTLNQINAGKPDADGWCRARSKFGGFEVDLPGHYVDTMIKIRGKTGFMVMHHLITRLPSGGEIGVSFMEMRGEPKLDIDPFESMVKQNKDRGTFAGREVVDIARHKADHLSIASPEIVAEAYRIRTAKGDHLILLQFPKKHDAELRKASKRILATFRIEKKGQIKKTGKSKEEAAN